MTNTRVEFTLPSAVIEPGEYEVNIDDKTVKISIALIPNKEAMRTIMGMESSSTGSGSVRIIGDEHGIANFSRITIEFPFLVENNDIEQRNSDFMKGSYSIKHECVKYLNRLIEVERWFTRKYWITPISEKDILYYKSYMDLDSGKKTAGFTMDFGKNLSLHFPLLIADESQIKPQMLSVLKDDAVPSFYDNLFLEAVNYYETQRFNEAVITLSIAFESFIAEYLFQRLKEKGLSDDEVEKKMSIVLSNDRRNGKSGMHRIMSLDFKDIDGRSLEESPELWAKFENFRKKRKNVIHPYTKMLQEEEAYSVLTDILEIWRWVDAKAYPPSVTKPKNPP